MANQGTNKFPYLVLKNISGDKNDKTRSPRSRNQDSPPTHSNRESNQSTQTPASGKAQGPHEPLHHRMAFSQDYAANLREPSLNRPQPPEFVLSGSQNQFSSEFNQALSSLSQMKAILTAQKELRKPAGSLYPTTSQFSLIPETQMIYKKYFPNDDDSDNSKATGSQSKLKFSEKASPPAPAKTNSSDENSETPGRIGDNTMKLSDTSKNSSSESLVKGRNSKIQGQAHVNEAAKSVSSNELITMKNGGVKEPPSGESKFRRKIHQQILSISAEVERQSSELSDLKKEVKELRQVARRNSQDNDGSKARLDTLSKHVHELDGKLDTVQESMSSQEKSILSKLMLIGEMSDSDSDDDVNTLKGLDALSSPSNTRVGFNSLSPKRPGSSGGAVASASSSSDFSFPKTCCNWIPIAPDFDKLVHAVALLNYRMDRNQSMKLCTTNSGATFKHSDVIDLTLYKNGMVLGSSGFRSYSTMSVIRFVNEIFNGYLPTELSTQFPDGVVIVLTDKRSVVHAGDVGFCGSGSKLMATDDPPDLFPGRVARCLRKLVPTSDSAISSATTSLTSLPTTTTSAHHHGSNEILLPDLKLELKEKVRFVTLKVNDRKAGQKYRLKVPIRATVKAVTDHLGKVIAEKNDITGKTNNDAGASTPKSWTLVLPVPHGKLSCLESTLEDYGITQNAFVYIQEIPTPNPPQVN